MKAIWKLQEAENQFGRLVENALARGPQYVIREGIETVVVISVREYEDMVSGRPGFREFLLSCPRVDENFEIGRQKDFPRDIEL